MFFRLSLIALILSGTLHLLFRLSMTVSDLFNRSVGAFFRLLLARLTGWIPFSVAEILLTVVLPLLIILAILVCAIHNLRRYRRALFFVFLSLPCAVYLLFVLTFAAGYSTSPLAERVSLKRAPVSGESLYTTAAILVEEIEALENEIENHSNGSSEMPFSFEELNAQLIDSYQRLVGRIDGLHTYSVPAKPILLSRPMVYTHITGVYSFFTGEANVNTAYPDYVQVYTTAHELAHQRGIAREDEANFVAFLACIEAEHPYIRYCGYMNLLEYVSIALYTADPESYADLTLSFNSTIRSELYGYQSFLADYENNMIGDISNGFNDAYLTVQGTPGVESYGLVVDLAVAYFQNQIQ